MDVLQKLEPRWGFDYVAYQIEHNEINFSDTGRIYVGTIKVFFDNIERELESIVNPKQDYFLVDNLKRLHEIIGGEKDFSKKGIENTIQKIDKIKKQLDNLVENPKEFYKSKDSEELFNLCKKINKIYELKFKPSY